VLSDLEELTTHIMYLQEGKMQFLKDLETLQEETGEIKLSKAIARLMRGQETSSAWIDQLFTVENKNDKIY
jgi:Cu-processing system ATP-binding protein